MVASSAHEALPDGDPAGERCAYCHALLDARFYFCASCATPYQDEAAVLPRVRPATLTAGQLVAQKAPHVAPLFWTYVAVVVGTVLLALLVVDEDRPDWAMFLADGVLFVTTFFFVVSHGRSLVPQLTRPGFDRWEAWAAVGALVPLLVLNHGYHTFLTGLVGDAGPTWLDELREAGLSRAAMIFFVAVFPAVSEEIAFRGLVQHWLHVAVTPARAIVVASALFTALHMSILSAPYLFLVGLLLGWVRWRTGSLYPPIVVHFLHNLAVLEILPP